MATAREVNVLVHGGFADGLGWEGVYQILRKDGYAVRVVQNPTLSLAGTSRPRTSFWPDRCPVLLVGHSYGGVVVTEAGNDPKVAGLVYIAAFAPDRGESVASLIKDPPPGAPAPPILPPQHGYLFLDKAKFHASFAADVGMWSGRRSWPTRRCRGVSRPSAGRSPRRRGRPSPAGTSWRLRTG